MSDFTITQDAKRMRKETWAHRRHIIYGVAVLVLLFVLVDWWKIRFPQQAETVFSVPSLIIKKGGPLFHHDTVTTAKDSNRKISRLIPRSVTDEQHKS